MYFCVSGIVIASFCDISIWLWNCSFCGIFHFHFITIDLRYLYIEQKDFNILLLYIEQKHFNILLLYIEQKDFNMFTVFFLEKNNIIQ